MAGLRLTNVPRRTRSIDHFSCIGLLLLQVSLTTFPSQTAASTTYMGSWSGDIARPAQALQQQLCAQEQLR